MQIAIIDEQRTLLNLSEVPNEDYLALQAHPTKAAFILPVVIDAQPTPTSQQVVESAGYVVEAAQVRRTWALRDKTAAELDDDALAAELVQIKALRSALQADVTAGLTAAPTTQAQAFAAIQDLKRRALRTDRVLLAITRRLLP